MKRFLLLAACVPLVLSAAEPAREALMKTDRDFSRAAEARDAAAFARFVGADVLTFPGGEVAKGSARMIEAWKPVFTPEGPAMRWEPEGAEASEAGDLGYTWGRYVRTLPAKAGTPAKSFTGRYVTIWKRGTDGAYRVVLDIGTPPSPVSGG